MENRFARLAISFPFLSSGKVLYFCHARLERLLYSTIELLDSSGNSMLAIITKQ